MGDAGMEPAGSYPPARDEFISVFNRYIPRASAFTLVFIFNAKGVRAGFPVGEEAVKVLFLLLRLGRITHDVNTSKDPIK